MVRRAELAAIVAAITPAYILDRAWNAVAWNDAAAGLFTGWLHGDAATPNQLRFMFLEPGARELVVGWPERAQRLVAGSAPISAAMRTRRRWPA
jgi:IS4 transposase